MLPRPDQVQRTVRCNPVQPGTEARAGFVPVELFKSLQECLLDDIFRVVFIACHTKRQTEDISAVALDKEAESVAIARPNSGDRYGVGLFHPAFRLSLVPAVRRRVNIDSTISDMRDHATILDRDKLLGVIGAGVMGQALVQGILRARRLKPDQIWAATRTSTSAQTVERELGTSVVTHYEDRLPRTGIVLLCVKPAHVASAIARLTQSGLPPDTLLISIAAGVNTAKLEELLGTVNPWIRAMPNTPSVVGESMTVICGGKHATPPHLEKAESLFTAVGQCK